MNHSNYIILFILLLFSCGNKNISFIEKFENKQNKIYSKKISKEDLEILLATNEVNQVDFKKEQNYYYGFKKRLNKNHYLLSYKETYISTKKINNVLLNWSDTYYCIYNIKTHKVNSKLRIYSSDPFLTYTIEEKGKYIVKTFFWDFLIKENEFNNSNEIIMEKDSLIETYKIINNKFKLVKN